MYSLEYVIKLINELQRLTDETRKELVALGLIR
jgi:hypothetical protein